MFANFCGVQSMILGAVAQLGEHCVRNAEVVGSIPIGSTGCARRGVSGAL